MNPPWHVPESWEWTRMSAVAEIIGGGTPRTDEPNNWQGGEIPWVTPADLSGFKRKLISRGSRNITNSGLENSGARLLPVGSVLFSSRAPIGYVAVAANALSTNQGFKNFVLNKELSPDYLFYFLKRGRELAVALASGTTFLEISGAKAGQIPFAVAPRLEQQRIVAEIEKQFTRLDAAVEALKRTRANLKRYRASVLRDACEGRLVPTEAELARAEGRDYEPADVLLQRILNERRAKWEAAGSAKMKAKVKTSKDDKWRPKHIAAALPEVDSLSALPDGWAWASVGNWPH